jgi:hypothetical protein
MVRVRVSPSMQEPKTPLNSDRVTDPDRQKHSTRFGRSVRPTSGGRLIKRVRVRRTVGCLCVLTADLASTRDKRGGHA